MNIKFDLLLENVLFEAFNGEYRAAVAVVQYGNKWLLGLAKDANDDRTGKWVCPGGGVKGKESAEQAAVRECYEETGIRCKAVGEPFTMPGKKDVAFVHCKVSGTPKQFKNNHEFAAVGLFTRKDMKALKLYHNVLKLIDRVT